MRIEHRNIQYSRLDIRQSREPIKEDGTDNSTAALCCAYRLSKKQKLKPFKIKKTTCTDLHNTIPVYRGEVKCPTISTTPYDELICISASGNIIDISNITIWDDIRSST